MLCGCAECRLVVAGAPLDLDGRARLVKATVELHAELLGCCTLLFHDPDLALLHDGPFGPGASVQVKLGHGPTLLSVFEGEVTSVEPAFRRDLPTALQVVCLDPLHRLALAPATRALEDVDDAQIVAQIAQGHGLAAEGPAGSPQAHLQANQSDAAFLRRIARNTGGALRLEGKKMVLGPPPSTAPLVLGADGGLQRLRVKSAAGGQVGEVSVHGWDSRSKREVVGRATPQGDLGEGARRHGRGASIAISGSELLPLDAKSAEAMARGRLQRLAEGFVRAKGDLRGEPRVVPGALVEFANQGPPAEGTFRIEQATHLYSKHGYRTSFSSVRVAKKRPPPPPRPPRPVPQARPTLSPEDIAKAKERAIWGLSNPRWAQQDNAHGGYAEMLADARNLDGRRVEFKVFHEEDGGNWTEIASKVVVARGPQVSAKVKLLHEDHPETPGMTSRARRPVAPLLSNTRWGKREHRHGEAGEMLVDVRGGDGQRVRFEVERNGPGGWSPYGSVDAEVQGGVARGTLSMLHPADEEATPQAGQALELRFTAHLLVESQPRAVRFEVNVL